MRTQYPTPMTSTRTLRAFRVRFLIFAAVAAIVFPGCAAVRANTTPSGRIVFEAVDPLQKIFRETSFFPAIDPSADVARGENASFQFVVRGSGRIQGLRAKADPFLSGSGARLAPPEVGYVGYVHVSRVGEDPSHDKLCSLSRRKTA